VRVGVVYPCSLISWGLCRTACTEASFSQQGSCWAGTFACVCSSMMIAAGALLWCCTCEKCCAILGV
jgi:hypothetical protein